MFFRAFSHKGVIFRLQGVKRLRNDSVHSVFEVRSHLCKWVEFSLWNSWKRLLYLATLGVFNYKSNLTRIFVTIDKVIMAQHLCTVLGDKKRILSFRATLECVRKIHSLQSEFLSPGCFILGKVIIQSARRDERCCSGCEHLSVLRKKITDIYSLKLAETCRISKN